MSDPFLGEIKLIGWNYAPRNWAFCNGQNLAISQNQALFSLLGTTFGGNGVTTFQLPNHQARVPMGMGNTTYGSPCVQGQIGGEAAHTLVLAETPLHTHAFLGTKTAGTTGQPSASAFVGSYDNGFAPWADASKTTMEPSDISPAGGNAAHENRQPYLCVNYVIALNGIYPSRN